MLKCSVFVIAHTERIIINSMPDKKDSKEPEIKHTDIPNRLALQNILSRLRHNRLVTFATKPLSYPLLTMIKEIIGIVLLVCFMVAIFLILKLTLLP